MRQKFLLLQDDAKEQLKICEYAVLENEPKHIAITMPQEGNYNLLCEETYDSQVIRDAIEKGLDDLIFVLRTPNLFPIQVFATKIAESVIGLFASKEDTSVELFFNDADLVISEPPEAQAE